MAFDIFMFIIVYCTLWSILTLEIKFQIEIAWSADVSQEQVGN